MSAPRKYPGELRERAVTLYRECEMVAVMRLTGELDRAALDALEHAATEHFTAGAAIVVLDFAAVTAFPSALFTRLHQLDTLARAHRRRLRLAHLDQAVHAVISQLRVSEDEPASDIARSAGARPV